MDLPPRHFISIDVSSAHRRDQREALGECSVDEAKNPAGRGRADRRLHHPRRRRRIDVDGTLRLEQRAQALLQPFEQLLELGAAMRDHRLDHRRHYFVANFRRPWQKECAEGFCRTHCSTSSLSWSKFSITKSARSTTGPRRVKPVYAAKLSTTAFISQSVIPSPTARIGPLRPMALTSVFLPVWRVSGDASSNPAYAPRSSKDTETA